MSGKSEKKRRFWLNIAVIGFGGILGSLVAGSIAAFVSEISENKNEGFWLPMLLIGFGLGAVLGIMRVKQEKK